MSKRNNPEAAAKKKIIEELKKKFNQDPNYPNKNKHLKTIFKKHLN